LGKGVTLLDRTDFRESNIAAQWLGNLSRILEVLDSTLSPGAG